MKAQEENHLIPALILITLDLLLWGWGIWSRSNCSVNMRVAQKGKPKLSVSLLTLKQPPSRRKIWKTSSQVLIFQVLGKWRWNQRHSCVKWRNIVAHTHHPELCIWIIHLECQNIKMLADIRPEAPYVWSDLIFSIRCEEPGAAVSSGY